MKMRLVLLVFFMVWPALVDAAMLSSDTVWQGDVPLTEDVLVPEGVILTVAAGARILVTPAEGTKTDPEFMSHQTEILVRGTLRVLGTSAAPVSFSGEGSSSTERWAGIIIDHGSASIYGCKVQGAEVGLHAMDARLDLVSTVVSDNRYGIVAQGEKTQVAMTMSQVRDNDFGLLFFAGARMTKDQNTKVEKNRKKDSFVASLPKIAQSPKEYRLEERPVTRIYRDEALLGNMVWQGRVAVEGMVRLAPEARLIILPGTVVEFSKKDTNNDGIGENGLNIQGVLVAKGTREKPILFRSAEAKAGPGDWDAINIMGSDQAQNLLEYCQIEHAYRGLHFHFSNVAVNHAVVRNNMRGLQFQESLVAIVATQVYGNASGIQARDSEVVFRDNEVFANQNGANFFRLNLVASGNAFLNNGGDGLRIREGTSRVFDNMMVGNRFGLLVADATLGNFTRNLLVGNLEAGMAMRNVDHLDIAGNIIEANAINGLSIQDARAAITGNLIAENGERGLGILSFSGTLTENNIVGNGLYALGLEGPGDVEAGGNWWGGSDLKAVIYDQHDESGLGLVRLDSPRSEPFPVAWPGAAIPFGVSWAGSILVTGQVNVAPEASLMIRPGTSVLFEKQAGLMVRGRIDASGTKAQRILFSTAEEKKPGAWDEIALDRAIDSRFVNCDFEYGAWGVHSHFANLLIDGCRFRNNEGGVRFRSGPLEVRHSLFSGNEIGLRSYRGEGVVRDSVITDNQVGVFVREQGGSLVLKRNNIFGNQRWNVRIGDFNHEDVDARENWWGEGSPGDLIFDGVDEPDLGKVLIDPVLPAQLTINIEASL